MWKRALGYGLLLAFGTWLLQWLDYQRLARAHAEEFSITLVALGFLALGVWVGMRLLPNTAATPAEDGNPKAQVSLGISGRELEVLQELALGYSNKEIAQRLGVSPNTVKTHVARLFEKLDARRRTDAIHKARQLGIVP